MNTPSNLPLALGLIIFSFLLNSLLVVPFINLLYRLRLTRRKEAQKGGTESLFDKLHDIKAGTPIGGGILIIVSVTLLFFAIFYFASFMGVLVRSAHHLGSELFVIFFTFLSFGLLGLTDDIKKIFAKGRAGALGFAYGLTRKQKFLIQWALAFFIGFLLFNNLGIKILHIPFLGETVNLGVFYIPFAAFLIVTFANAFNITDGLDGLSCGLLVIFLLTFGFIAAASLDTPLWIFIALWIGALMAFLYFNVYPARIFLGDAGALSFGATIAVIGLLTGGVFALVVVGGIFLLEVTSSAIQIFGWRVLKRPILPMAPIHHAFQAMGWEEPKIVMRAWLAGIMLAIFGLWLATI
ncbi:phospho-N-acetylmuramoyl-pentapeptide-transferase [Candidatus Woesebacteria bacterium]|nr:phospho-N-acetylmuramoyl-pentapeptide-transferase [Candidatus Woesebacteria bacterium]